MTDTTEAVEAYILVVEADAGPVLVEGGEDYAVTIQVPETLIVAIGEQGPAGPQGAPGPAGGAAFQRSAGEALSALRAVYEWDGQVFTLDYRDEAHIALLAGLTLTSASVGQPLNVQNAGAVDDAGWTWAPGPVWLGADGVLTQTPPLDGFDVLIGAAVSATRLLLNLQPPIDLE
jgi:hypothetical protein